MERQTITGRLSTSGRLSGALSVGGGTTDYNELENKPTYNGHIIEGDLTSESLGIWQPKNFSTEEQNTGIKWIDGSPIYVRVFEGQISGSDCIFYLDFNIKYATALCNIYNGYWIWDEQYMYCIIGSNYISITKKVSGAYGSNNLCKIVLFYVKEN